MSFSRLFACYKKDNPATVVPLEHYPTVLRFCAFPGDKLINPTLNEIADVLKEIFNGKMVGDKIIYGLSGNGILLQDLYVSPYDIKLNVEPNHLRYAYLELELPLDSMKLALVKVQIENIVSIRDSRFDPICDDERKRITGKYLLDMLAQKCADNIFTR